VKGLKPLLYLTYKTVFNGLKRALTTPRRLISFIAFVAYYFFLFIRPYIYSNAPTPMPGSVVGAFQFPPLDILDGFAFGLFLVFSLLLMVGIFGTHGVSRQADVDVLFPTPVSPKVVLGFRICRDYLFTLITPFLIALLGFRASKMGWEALFRNMPHPEYSALALRALTVSWILMAMCFVAINHATGLFINRTDRTGDRNKAIFSWVAGIYVFGWIAFLAWSISREPTWNHVLHLAQWPLLRVAFFIPALGAVLAMAPFHGSILMAALPAGGLVATIAVAMKMAMAQASWYYDESAIRGFNSTKQRELQRAGDLAGIVAERARSGKFKVRRMLWLHRLQMRGPAGLLWKELFLQPRTILTLIVFVFGMQICLAWLSGSTANDNRDKMTLTLFLTLEGFLTMFITLLMGQTGFIEVLKRVDFEKALPFSPAVIVVYEIIGRSMVGIVGAWIGCVTFLLVSPAMWSYALAAAIAIPCLSLLLTAGVFFVTMLFPDVEDPSQRQFRGLMMLLGIGITSFFPVGIIIGLLVIRIFPPVAALAGSVVALGLAAILGALSGQLYATFNPSE